MSGFGSDRSIDVRAAIAQSPGSSDVPPGAAQLALGRRATARKRPLNMEHAALHGDLALAITNGTLKREIHHRHRRG